MSDVRPHGRALIDAALRERSPTARDRERVLATLLSGAALTTTATAAATPSLLAKLTSGAAKWWLVGSMCTAAVGGGYLVANRAGAPAAVAAASSAPAAPGATPRAPIEPPPVSVALPEAAAPAPKPAPVAPPVRSLPDLERELAELHAAHAAYRDGRSEQALSLLAQHRQRFPKSQLGVERSTLEVLTLCRLGRRQQAQALAAKLRGAARGSAALSGLEGSCAAAPK
jgi:hypothetical protein